MKRKTTMRTTCALVLAALPSAMAGPPSDAREVAEDQSLTTKLVTPHKPWAKGYAAGPVRALFVVHGGGYGGKWFAPGTRLREVVELLQRFDLDADAVFCGGRGKGADFLGLDLGKERAERLLGKPYDVYVFAGFSFEKLPAKFRYLVMERVAKGAGLVCCGPQTRQFMIAKRRVDAPALTAGLPAIGEMEPQALMQAYRLGKGRGVHMKYAAWTLTPRLLFSWRGLAEYDYRMLWVGRAVLWAAGRERGVAVQFAVDEGRRATVTLSSKATVDAEVAIEARRACDGRKYDLGTQTAKILPQQASKLAVTLPHLRAGDYYIDAVVKSGKGVEACAAAAFNVASDFGVEKVEMGRTFAERGERIKGSAVLRGSVPENSVLRLRFRDSYNRVLDQRDVPVAAGKGTYEFEYGIGAFDTILMRVEAVLIAAGREIDMRDASFTVPKRRRGRFNFLQWDTPRDVLGYYAWQQLKRAGMSCCLMGSFGESRPISTLQASDISLVPYSTRILDPKDDQGFTKPCCWNDEAAVTEHVRKIVNNQAKHREHGVWVYSLGDEGVTKGCCVHPACIDAYRRYLQSQYGTIDKLNASWGATYKSFGEVDLLDHKDNMEREALAKGLWPRWFDRQAFARHNLMKLSGRFVEAYKGLDPKAVTGFEGTGSFGDDYDLICGTNTFYSPYPSIGDDLVRSIAPRDLIRANWMGYSKAPDPLVDAAWRMVIKGMDSVWYWMWTGVGSWRGYLSPTLDFLPAIEDLANEMRPVREGLGDVLLQSQPAHSGIGVFYSVPSALSASVENSREFLHPKQTHESWARLTYDVGLDFRYVSSAMLKAGALTTDEFKVLLLPMAQAIAPDEAAAIRSFVQAGGTAIADVRPGIYDGHCKPITPGALDQVFGTKRTGRGSPSTAAVSLKTTLNGKAVAFQAADASVDTGVAPTSAKALGTAGAAPVLLVNKFGAGQAILLNFQVRADKADDEQLAANQKLVKALYQAVGTRAPVAAASPDAGPLSRTETRVWRNGDALVFGMWRQMECRWFGPQAGTEPGEPVPAKVTLRQPLHVYDLRAQKYLGSVTQVDTVLRWGRANFFLALPYKIEGLDVRLSSSAPKRGETLKAAIRLKAAKPIRGRHAVWVEVVGPDGKPADWAGQVAMLNDGVGEVSVPVAYNDAAGAWRIRARELFSRSVAEAGWTVK